MQTHSTHFQNKPRGSGVERWAWHLGHGTIIPARGRVGHAARLPPGPWQGDTSLSPFASSVLSAWRWPPHFPGTETAYLRVTPHNCCPGKGQGPVPAVQGQFLSCARPPVMQVVSMDLFACLALSPPRLPGSHARGLQCLLGALAPCQGSFLIFTGMKTFPKSKCLGGFEEFPLETK